ncbi:MAG: endolytic transglycosylase MltG [Acidithiobacillus sp.]|uniref:endolytic transglycosylase MltG n=1 Tax=Acidithiobacillus sp. TaxID=1872118 RepID=UPI003D0853BD
MGKVTRALLKALLLLVILLVGDFLYALYWPRTLAPTEVVIFRGSGADTVFAQLEKAQVLAQPWMFRLAWVLRGRPALHAGLYRFQGRVRGLSILNDLVTGRSLPLNLTIVPGSRLQQIYDLAQRAPYLDWHELPPRRELVVLLRQAGWRAHSAEGLLLPDSYRYVPGDPATAVLLRAARGMHRELDRLWASRAPNLPLHTPYQALILASIVQKEGAPASQQERIAAVFLNRLRRGMPLQSDPTVIYALGDAYQGKLTSADMRVASPYNTYLHPGLPPAPISMPGLQALKAVLHPAHTDDLYFIAKDGQYHYSRDYAEHLQQIRRYLQGKGAAGG